MATYSHRDLLPGTTLPLGAGSARYLTSLELEIDEAADLVRRAEPIVARMVALSPDVVGQGTLMVCEALALARGLAPGAVRSAVSPHIPRAPLETAFLEQVAGAGEGASRDR